ncbi:MAG: ATP-binding cassette domain-containing protein [Clostridiaceae bacterium]
MTMDNVVSMSNVFVDTKIRKKVLDIKNFTMKRGELVAIVGPNGAGKSTFLQAINLLKPWQEELKLFGKNVDSFNETFFRRRSSLVFQKTLLLNETVFNNVARALVTDPELLLLDEPSASLDVAMRSELIEKIRQLAEERGISVVLISHNFSDVLHFADRAVVMFDGNIIQDDNPEVIMRKPVNEKVAKLVGMDNIISCKVNRINNNNVVTLETIISFVHMWDISEKVTKCCIPGDCIYIYHDNLIDKKHNWIVLEGIIDRILPDVSGYKLKVKVSDQIINSRILKSSMDSKIYKSASIKLAFNLDDVHFI